MKKDFVCIGLIILHLSAVVFAQEFKQPSALTNSWAVHGSGAKEDTGSEIFIDDSGNIYVTGFFEASLTFETETITAPGYGIFFAKFDITGNLIWLKHLQGGTDNRLHWGYGLGTDNAGNCYLAGFFDTSLTIDSEILVSYGGFDIFVAKFDPDGNVLWARNAGGTDLDEAHSLAVDGSGNCYITGYFGGVATFGTETVTTEYGDREVFVAKYDSDGTILWVKQAEGTALKWDWGMGIAADIEGNCFVTGYFESRAVFDNEELISLGGHDVFVVKYDPDGNVLWAKQAGGIDWDEGNNIAVDRWGNCYVTGYFGATANFGTVTLVSNLGEREIFIARFDNDGDVVWAKQAAGTALRWNTGWDIDVDCSGNSYITGYFEEVTSFDGITLTGRGGRDVFVAKYDINGNVIWVDQTGGSDWDEGRGIAIDRQGHCLVTGYFMGTATFGNNQFVSTDYRDIFISSYDISYTENCWADLDGDGDVDIVDVQMVAGRWGAKTGDANYLAVCDVDRDCDIDIVDVQMVAGLWGTIF
jgi:hypothetical protein